MEAFADKQEYEEYYIDFDFVNVINLPDEIATATVTAADAGGNDATSTITTAVKQNIASPKVYVWVKAGTTGTTYTITCKIVTDNGEKYELEGSMEVINT